MEEGSPRALQILPAKPTVIPVLSVFFCLSLSFVLLLVSLSPWELGVRGVKRGNFLLYGK